MAWNDSAADGLALVEARHRNDREAVEIILDNCDARQTAKFLSWVVADMVESMAIDPGELLTWLRATMGPGE
jgi:hypothetical protein